MRLFYRSHLPIAAVLSSAESFFTALGCSTVATALRGRTFTGPLGTARLTVKAEYINVYDSKRWRENGLAAAARYVGVSVPAYEAMILRARQAIARAFG